MVMRPARKSRSVNKWNDYVSEVSPVKDVDSPKGNDRRKRKLSDTTQWSEEELRRFYEAYREHGKDWKKVAAVLRNRPVEMVKSLYTMNKAYLSLPEGTASVAGLIAMMSDHYSNLGRSDSEQESSDDAATLQKPQKRIRGKADPGNSKASGGKFNAHPLTAASSYGCLPLIKTEQPRGSIPHAAGKRTPRTPRFLVSNSCENIQAEKFLSLARQSMKKNVDAKDDGAAHELGLALTEASAKDGSPEFSQTSNRVGKKVRSSPAHSAEVTPADLERTNGKNVESERDDDNMEGSTKDSTGELCKHKNLKHSERFGTLVQKGRSSDRNKLDVDDSKHNHSDDRREVGKRFGVGHEKLCRDARISRSSLQDSRKKRKGELFSRDEASAIEALQTLADLSLRMASVENEDETLVQIKEEKDKQLQEPRILEAMPGKSQTDKHRSAGVREKGDSSISGFEVASNNIPKSCKVSATDVNLGPEMKKRAYRPKTMRNKPNMLESKARDAGKMRKTKKYSQNASSKPVKDTEHSSRTHLRRQGSNNGESNEQVLEANEISRPTKVRSRRKMHLKKSQKENAFSEQFNSLTASVHDVAFTPKEKLITCLSNPQLRQWCKYEWFYSAIDYPWFAKREFVEYLHHVGLGHVPMLTHLEWSVIRSSLGKPRRFSQQFLKEETKKLHQYRDSVRKHYADLRKGTLEGLPTDLARPLSVGQRVIAIHPKTREIHEGDVLIVDNSRCRVQFDRPDQGVEFVMDIDCMPSNHLENIPTPLARRMTCDQFFWNNKLRMNEQAKEYGNTFHGEIENINIYPQDASEDADKQTGILHSERPAYQELVNPQHSRLAQIQAKQADVQGLAELTSAVDKKVSLSLRQQNALHETISLPQPGFVADLGDHGGSFNSLDHSACQPRMSGHVIDIIKNSKTKARTMVHVAMQTVSLHKNKENTKIEETIDIVNDQLTLDDSFTSPAPDPVLTTASNKNDVPIPTELITQCVATLLMIQKCTERQFPPADIAQILQSAVASLKPRCPENLPAHAEVQKCMGMIKNQIMSLLPA